MKPTNRAGRPGRMSEVLQAGRSLSRGTDRLILAILADAAHADGIVWWGQELIASEANCSVREVRRATEELERLVDVEIRWAQHGRSRIKVYRVVVGRFGERELEYSRLPFDLDEPFSHPDILSARREALRANLAHDWRLVEGHGDTRTDRPGEREADTRTSATVSGGQTVRRQADKLAVSRTRRDHEALEEALGEATESDDSVPPSGEQMSPAEQLRWALSAALGCRPSTRSEHGAWEKAIAELVEAGATAEQVSERCAIYRRRWPNMALTPIALTRWWGWLEGAAEGVAPTKDETRTRWIEESSWLLETEDAHWIVDEWGLDPRESARYHEEVDRVRERRAAEAAA